MSRKMVLVCVKKDLTHPISWALREFEGKVSVRYLDHSRQLAPVLEGDKDNECCTLILDSIMDDESTLEIAKQLKESKPSLKILLIASSGTTKEEIVGLIQSKVVSGVLVRPFTAEQISDYIYKLCGFKKPTEVPWYMQT